MMSAVSCYTQTQTIMLYFDGVDITDGLSVNRNISLRFIPSHVSAKIITMPINRSEVIGIRSALVNDDFLTCFAVADPINAESSFKECHVTMLNKAYNFNVVDMNNDELGEINNINTNATATDGVGDYALIMSLTFIR
jgi:hypothetical protein